MLRSLQNVKPYSLGIFLSLLKDKLQPSRDDGIHMRELTGLEQNVKLAIVLRFNQVYDCVVIIKCKYYRA